MRYLQCHKGGVMSGEVGWLENRLRDISQEAFRSRERLTDALCDMYEVRNKISGELVDLGSEKETFIMRRIDSVINVLEQETVL